MASPIRLLLSSPLSFGPGKAELLERIGRTGRLQAAAEKAVSPVLDEMSALPAPH